MVDKRALLARSELQNTHEVQQSPFTITEHLCYYWWERINVGIFDGQLAQPIRFEIKRYRDDWGWCYRWRPNAKPKRVLFGINTDIPNLPMFLEVLLHESIHQWEWEIGLLDWNDIVEHTEVFHQWVNTINQRYNLQVFLMPNVRV